MNHEIDTISVEVAVGGNISSPRGHRPCVDQRQRFFTVLTGQQRILHLKESKLTPSLSALDTQRTVSHSRREGSRKTFLSAAPQAAATFLCIALRTCANGPRYGADDAVLRTGDGTRNVRLILGPPHLTSINGSFSLRAFRSHKSSHITDPPPRRHRGPLQSSQLLYGDRYLRRDHSMSLYANMLAASRLVRPKRCVSDQPSG